MPAQILQQIVGWFSLPVLAVLVGILIWRRVPREFLYFFNYLVINEGVGLVRLWFYYARYRSYNFVYGISDLLIALFAFLASYELFIKRLFPRFYAVRFYRYLFPAAAVIITLSAVPAALHAPRSLFLATTIHVFDILRVATLIFFIGLMTFMGRQWTRYELGIAMGLVVEASGLLVTSALWTQKPFMRHLLDQLPPISYDIACLIWLITFLKPEKPTPAPAAPIAPEVLQEARKWEETLKGSLRRKKEPD